MSRRARRGAATSAESARQPVAVSERSDSKNADAPLGSRRRRKRDLAAAETGAAATSIALAQDDEQDTAATGDSADAPIAEHETSVGASDAVAETTNSASELADGSDTDASASASASASAKDDAHAVISLDQLPAALREALIFSPDEPEEDARTLQLGEPLVLSAAADIVVSTGETNSANDVNALVDEMPFDEDGPYEEVLPFDEDGPYDEVPSPAGLSFDRNLTVGSVSELPDPVQTATWRDMPPPTVEQAAQSEHPEHPEKSEQPEHPDESAPHAEVAESIAGTADSSSDDGIRIADLADSGSIDSEHAAPDAIADSDGDTDTDTDAGADAAVDTDADTAADADREDESAEPVDAAPVLTPMTQIDYFADADADADAEPDVASTAEAVQVDESDEADDVEVLENVAVDARSDEPDATTPSVLLTDQGHSEETAGDAPEASTELEATPEVEATPERELLEDSPPEHVAESAEDREASTEDTASAEGTASAEDESSTVESDELAQASNAAANIVEDPGAAIDEVQAENNVVVATETESPVVDTTDLENVEIVDIDAEIDENDHAEDSAQGEDADEDADARATSDGAEFTEYDSREREHEQEQEQEDGMSGDMNERAAVAEQARAIPEPLVEPAPLPRSSFEPDLSKLGRTDAAPDDVEPLRVKPVRPLGEEAVFTTADRLRASAFAPVASERVADHPAPAAVADDEAPIAAEAEPSSHGTQPRSAVAAAQAQAGPIAPEQDRTESSSAAENHAGVDTCSQCGNELSESDIFCGSCGFVKHGVGPSSRVAAPVRDPFPWGTPSGEKTVANAPESNELNASAENLSPESDAIAEAIPASAEVNRAEQDDEAEQSAGVESADVPVENENQSSDIDARSADQSAAVPAIAEVAEAPNDDLKPQPELDDVESSEILEPRTSAESATAAAAKAEDAPSESFDAGVAEAVDSASERGEAIPLIEPGSVEPEQPVVSGAEANAPQTESREEGPVADAAQPHLEAAPPLETGAEGEDMKGNAAAATTASGVPGFSVLAPPPKSNQRVELPISPPVPLAALGADEADIEDTRIVERSVTGTRFVLQFSTGDSVIVTGNGLVGRNPIPEPSEKFDIVVPITDPSKSVSKTHLEFGQMSGVFWISDRYSGNGTIVREPGAEPKRCEPGKRYRVVRGTRVEIGEQFFIVS
ncbi:FHA domain-containing protein [Salinibacterium amurskyense]|uniref:FHA domain-containing protein n=1 Tax=Salinibacterium amurskyense TaxID=205941 RepID=UPI00312001B7